MLIIPRINTVNNSISIIGNRIAVECLIRHDILRQRTFIAKIDRLIDDVTPHHVTIHVEQEGMPQVANVKGFIDNDPDLTKAAGHHAASIIGLVLLIALILTPKIDIGRYGESRDGTAVGEVIVEVFFDVCAVVGK